MTIAKFSWRGARPSPERAVKRAELREAEKERDFADGEIASDEVLGRALVPELLEHRPKRRLLEGELPGQRPHAHLQTRGAAPRVRFAAAELLLEHATDAAGQRRRPRRPFESIRGVPIEDRDECRVGVET